MKIFLLPVDEKRTTFNFREDVGAGKLQHLRNQTEGGGWLSRLRFQMIRYYWKLERRFPQDERLCRCLWKAEEVELIHPDSLSGVEARGRFLNFLRQQARKHRLWAIIDSLLAIAGAPLFWLPGPNIFFFYPAIRALSHFYAMKGSEKFLSSQRVRLKASARIDVELQM